MANRLIRANRYDETQILLYRLMDAEAAVGNLHTAERIADKAARMAPLFDLWQYNAYVAPLEIAVKSRMPTRRSAC